MGIKVERPPQCPECKVDLDYLDDYIVSWMFRCPQCRRGYTVTERDPKAGWERVAFVFDYAKAPIPRPPSDYPIAWAEEEQWVVES